MGFVCKYISKSANDKCNLYYLLKMNTNSSYLNDSSVFAYVRIKKLHK